MLVLLWGFALRPRRGSRTSNEKTLNGGRGVIRLSWRSWTGWREGLENAVLLITKARTLNGGSGGDPFILAKGVEKYGVDPFGVYSVGLILFAKDRQIPKGENMCDRLCFQSRIGAPPAEALPLWGVELFPIQVRAHAQTTESGRPPAERLPVWGVELFPIQVRAHAKAAESGRPRRRPYLYGE